MDSGVGDNVVDFACWREGDGFAEETGLVFPDGGVALDVFRARGWLTGFLAW